MRKGKGVYNMRGKHAQQMLVDIRVKHLFEKHNQTRVLSSSVMNHTQEMIKRVTRNIHLSQVFRIFGSRSREACSSAAYTAGTVRKFGPSVAFVKEIIMLTCSEVRSAESASGKSRGAKYPA